MYFTQALVRPPSKIYAKGLTTADLGPPVLTVACRQHARYVAALRARGIAVTELAPDDRYPDSTFVEDCAILAADAVIWTRPGAPSRLGEVVALKEALCLDHPNLLPAKSFEIVDPGTVDGGDVCQVEDLFLIGISERTNQAGADQLADILDVLGFKAEAVDVRGLPDLLHLKSGLTYLGGRKALAVDAIRHHSALRGLQVITPPAGEEYAANCIPLDERTLLLPRGYPLLARQLKEDGFDLVDVEMGEFRKMDGGPSCLSLRF